VVTCREKHWVKSPADDFLIFKLVKGREIFKNINISNKREKLSKYFLEGQTIFIDFWV